MDGVLPLQEKKSSGDRSQDNEMGGMGPHAHDAPAAGEDGVGGGDHERWSGGIEVAG